MPTYEQLLPLFLKACQARNISVYDRETNIIANARKFKRYLKDIENVFTTCDVTEAAHKVKMLQYIGGREVERVYYFYPEIKVVNTDDTLKDDYLVFLAKLRKFHNTARLSTTSRLTFHQASQRPEESINAYHLRLEDLYEDTGYGDTVTKDQLLVDKLVAGTRSEKIRTEMLAQEKLELSKVLEYANNAAMAVVQSKMMNLSNQPSTATVNKTFNRGNGGTKNKKPFLSKCCRFCGGASHSRDNCPAKNKTCHFCKKTGHFANICEAKNRTTVQKKSSGGKFKRSKKVSEDPSVQNESEPSQQTDNDILSALVNHVSVE